MPTMPTVRLATPLLLAALMLTSACENDPTVPTPVVDQSVEVHAGPLDPNGSIVYLFTLNSPSTVQLMLAGAVVGGPLRSVDTTLRVGLTAWDPVTSACQPVIQELDLEPRLTAMMQRMLDPGTYCAKVSDPGTLDRTVGVVLRVTAPALVRIDGEPGTDTLANTLTVGGLVSRTFHVSSTGQVDVTLQGLTGDHEVGLGIGVVSTEGVCHMARTVTARPGTTPQLSTRIDAGVYCAAVFDIGNLTGQHAFAMSIQHP